MFLEDFDNHGSMLTKAQLEELREVFTFICTFGDIEDIKDGCMNFDKFRSNKITFLHLERVLNK